MYVRVSREVAREGATVMDQNTDVSRGSASTHSFELAHQHLGVERRHGVRAHRNGSAFHSPLLVSAGGDQALGMYEPSDTANLGHLAAYHTADDLLDNITNRNRRSGARR